MPSSMASADVRQAIEVEVLSVVSGDDGGMGVQDWRRTRSDGVRCSQLIVYVTIQICYAVHGPHAPILEDNDASTLGFSIVRSI